MRNHISLLILAILYINCSGNKNNKLESSDLHDTLQLIEADGFLWEPEGVDSAIYRFMEIDSTVTYQMQKSNMKRIKESLQSDNDSLSLLFETHFLKNIVPYWYGTDWTFEGHTSTPGEGSVACGYFVSTTLKDAGFNLNRYRFAQQSPLDEARTLSMGDSVRIIQAESTGEIISEMNETLVNGLYFLGFNDYHVGFLINSEEGLFVLHSNYLYAGGVEVERLESSLTFSYCLLFYVVPISNNRKLMRAWINNTELAMAATMQ